MADREHWRILITPDDGLHVVQTEWYINKDDWDGEILDIEFDSKVEAKRVRDQITLSVVMATLKAARS